jgi:hypothetical protein
MLIETMARSSPFRRNECVKAFLQWADSVTYSTERKFTTDNAYYRLALPGKQPIIPGTDIPVQPYEGDATGTHVYINILLSADKVATVSALDEKDYECDYNTDNKLAGFPAAVHQPTLKVKALLDNMSPVNLIDYRTIDQILSTDPIVLRRVHASKRKAVETIDGIKYLSDFVYLFVTLSPMPAYMTANQTTVFWISPSILPSGVIIGRSNILTDTIIDDIIAA